MELVWRERFRVRFYDVDPYGRVTLPALCRFLQIAADEHAQSAGASLEDLQAAGNTWVLAELALAVHTFPVIGDTVTVETWGASRMGGARAYRDFLLYGAGGVQVGAASSLWLFLDAATRRPSRLPDVILRFRVPDREPVSLDPLPPLPATAGRWGEATSRVGWLDLDQNGHANNIRYLDWALAAVRESVWASHQPWALTSRFQNEARLGDLLRSRVRAMDREDGAVMEHLLERDEGQALATVSTRWRPLPEAQQARG